MEAWNLSRGCGGPHSTGGKVAFWRSALGTIGIYIPFKKISLGTAGKFSPSAGHVWKHGTYLADAGGCISTGARGGVWRSALGGTIGIPFKKISLGTAGKFSHAPGHV